MKYKLSNLVLVSLVVLVAQASLAVTVLHLDRFREKGLAAVTEAVGAKNIVGEGRVFFKDGAGSMDLEPLFDHAAYHFVVTVKTGVLSSDDLRLGYRLNLSGSEDLVLLADPEKNPQFPVAMPGEGLVVLKDGAKEKSVASLLAKLKTIAPKGEFTHLKAVGVLVYQVKVLEAPAILKELKRSGLASSVEPNYENYRVPFRFEPAIEVRETGRIDADKHRTLTKKLREEGYRFATETTVPADLQ